MTETPHTACCLSPIGVLEIVGTPAGILAVRFLDELPAHASPTHPCLQPCLDQLAEYFAGRRTAFSVPLQLRGTPFQQRVWAEVLTIPYGATRSYLSIAESLGDPGAVRAVGAANASNPIPILVPCHRVIASDGSLAGYGGGLWRKRWLLEHEGRPAQPSLFG